MCVIMVVEEEDPTVSTVTECWDHNSFGAGIAWREQNAVRWVKGAFGEPDTLHQRLLELPKPYLVHFRVPTVGDVCDELCHPFPLGGSLALSGSTTDGVVAHNGHWNLWQDTMLRFVGVTRIPDGPWSDSRAIAWIVKQSGMGFLELVDDAQKIVLFTPTRLDRFGRWSQERGIWFSNMTWSGESAWRPLWPGRGRPREKGAPPIEEPEDDYARFGW